VTATSFTVTGLSTNSQYSFRVSAVNAWASLRHRLCCPYPRWGRRPPHAPQCPLQSHPHPFLLRGHRRHPRPRWCLTGCLRLRARERCLRAQARAHGSQPLEAALQPRRLEAQWKAPGPRHRRIRQRSILPSHPRPRSRPGCWARATQPPC
jgi:hypothetical protein